MANQKKEPEQKVNVGEAVSRSEEFINNNKKTISTIVIAIVVLIAGGFALSNYYFKPRQQKALEALYPGEQYFAKGDYEKALNGDTYDYAGFEAVAKSYKGTKAANLAKAYAGLSLVKLDRFEEAVPFLKAFKGKDMMVAPSVKAALGNSYAQLEKYGEAASTLVEAAAMADNNLLSPMYLVQAGQLFEKEGKTAEALKVYKEVKEKYYASAQAADIDKYIERVSK